MNDKPFSLNIEPLTLHYCPKQGAFIRLKYTICPLCERVVPARKPKRATA
jgi:hypothetical protein